jgi:DNA-binding beta-propeller fold protein YncE
MMKKTLLIILLYILCVSGTSGAFECVNVKTLFDIKYKFNQPSDISVAPNGDIYVVNGVNSKIMVFNSRGDYKYSFGREGSGNGEFILPKGIDISDSGRIFIADSGNHRIQVFDINGRYLYQFPVESSSRDHHSDPVDVLVSKIKNYLYVSDNDNHLIKVYTQKGSFEFEWGTFGEEFGQFRYPGIMARNENNEVFVVDVLNTRVQKFDPFGDFLSDIGSWGVSPGKFFRPKGVALDNKRRVFIGDSYMGVLQAFTETGSFIGVVCEKYKKRTFKTPVGLFISRNDRLFVVEMLSSRVTVLKILD